MHIKELSLTDFRNYTSESVEFGGGLNLITGQNAAGKTNLLEAVYLFAVGKSPLAVKDKELVRMGADFAHIKAVVCDKYRSRKLELYIDGFGKKRILVDGVPISKISELIGTFKVVFFSPDDLKMISEAPADRRRFMDVSLSQQSKRYYYSLLRYNTVLAQRNKLLKLYENRKSTLDTLDVWDGELIKYGTDIIELRREFITGLMPIADAKHRLLSSGTETLELAYEGICGDVHAEFEKALLAARDKDMDLRYTTVGPHRDDIAIEVNGIDVRKYGSRGQQRTTSLALKLAEAEIFNNLTGEYPCLLLDDVMSELDATRCERLISALSDMQTIITDTEYTNTSAAQFFVQKGTIKKIIDNSRER